MELWLSIILFIIGLAILIKGSDLFIDGVVFMARHFGVSELIIGLTLVSMGTSLPELGASVYASYTGKGGIAVGNVVGSNIANIALVLGVCLMLRHIMVKEKVLMRDGIIMLCVSLLFTFFAFGGVVRWESILLMVLFIIYIIFLYKENKEEVKNEPESRGNEDIEEEEKGLAKGIAKVIIGCLGVIFGAKLMVDAAVDIATTLKISETVIGSTIVAFGTSVPELAVSLSAVLKKHEDISLGNIIGSNIFNILWVIGVAGLVNNLAVDAKLLYPNVLIMLSVAVLLLVFMATKRRLERWEGVVFVVIYAVFLLLNYW